MTHTIKSKVKRPLIALSMAASIAMTPLAVTPAQAGDDASKFIAGIIALGLIGVIIENNSGHRVGTNRYDPYHNVPESKRLPARCVKTYESTRGTMTMASKDCLRDNFHYWRSMPRQCAVQVQYRRHSTHYNKTAYRLPCLDNHGYHIVSEY